MAGLCGEIIFSLTELILRKNIPGTTGWQGKGSLSQFVPGRTGTGYTEEPDSVAQVLLLSGAHVLHHRTGFVV